MSTKNVDDRQLMYFMEEATKEFQTFFIFKTYIDDALDRKLRSAFKRYRYHIFSVHCIIYIEYKSHMYEKVYNEIKSLFKPKQIYTQKQADGKFVFVGDEDMCAICLDNSPDMHIDLVCGHIFHERCLKPIAGCIDDYGFDEYEIECPVCRQVHETNIIPIEYVISRGVNMKNGILYFNNDCDYSPSSNIFETTNEEYNDCSGDYPLWWDILTVN